MSKHGSSLQSEDDSFESHDTTADGGSHFQSLAQAPKGGGAHPNYGGGDGMVMEMEMEMEMATEVGTAAATALPVAMAGTPPEATAVTPRATAGLTRRYRPIQITASPLHNNTNLVM